MAENKKPKFARFSITVRTETQTLIDRLANQENRTRSSMIDTSMVEVCKKLLKETKQPLDLYKS